MTKGKKIGLFVATGLAWAATVFTHMLPDLRIAHASPDEARPFVIAFGGLALALTGWCFKVLNTPSDSAPPGAPPAP